jgi:hypothetical protein
VRISLDRLRRLLSLTQVKTPDPANRPCRIGIRRRQRHFAKAIGSSRFKDDRRRVAAMTFLKAHIGELTTPSLTSCALRRFE